MSLKKKLSLAVSTAVLGAGVVGVGGMVAPTASFAVAYCSIGHHYGTCTWNEIYQNDLEYWDRTLSYQRAVLKAIDDANKSIIRNLH